MIPIVLGVAALAALLIPRDSRKEENYSEGPPNRAPIDFLGEDRTGDNHAFVRDVYLGLHKAGVTDLEIDRGYYPNGRSLVGLTGYKLIDQPLGSEDGRIHELEILQTALDRYERTPNENLREIISDFPVRSKSYADAARLRFYRKTDGKADPQTVKTQIDYLQRAMNLDRGNLDAMVSLNLLWPEPLDRDRMSLAVYHVAAEKFPSSQFLESLAHHARHFYGRDNYATDPVESAHGIFSKHHELEFVPRKDTEFAAKTYDELRRQAPGEISHHYRYGILMGSLGLEATAQDALRQAIKTVDPDSNSLPEEFGLAHLALGDSLRSMSPAESMLHYLIASDFFKSRDPVQRSKVLRSLMTLFENMAGEATAKGEFESFLQALDEQTKHFPKPELYLLHGRFLQESGKLKEAAEAYRQVLRLDEGDLAKEARSRIQQILTSLGDGKETKEYRQLLRQAIEPGVPL